MSAWKDVKDSANVLARRFATPPVLDPKVRDKCRRRTIALVHAGRLTREPCEWCGAEKVQAHHENYQRPELVRWLCQRCHHGVHHCGWLLPLRELPVNPTDDESARWIAGGLFRIVAIVADEREKQSAAPTPVKLESKAYLTVDEASDLTGLTPTFLKRMIKLGTLTAIRDRGWKIRRKDLEAL